MLKTFSLKYEKQKDISQLKIKFLSATQTKRHVTPNSRSTDQRQFMGHFGDRCWSDSFCFHDLISGCFIWAERNWMDLIKWLCSDWSSTYDKGPLRLEPVFSSHGPSKALELDGPPRCFLPPATFRIGIVCWQKAYYIRGFVPLTVCNWICFEICGKENDRIGPSRYKSPKSHRLNAVIPWRVLVVQFILALNLIWPSGGPDLDPVQVENTRKVTTTHRRYSPNTRTTPSQKPMRNDRKAGTLTLVPFPQNNHPHKPSFFQNHLRNLMMYQSLSTSLPTPTLGKERVSTRTGLLNVTRPLCFASCTKTSTPLLGEKKKQMTL